MFKSASLQAKLNGISAKTLSLGAKQYMRARNEQQVKLLEQYQYPPLSGPRSIRLLQIESGADTDVVSVRLFETDLDQMPGFDALSYTWNLDPTFSVTKMSFDEDEKKEERPIMCNGRTRLVSMNLYHALTEFRRQGMQSSLWADQICINQLDNREKAAQLAIMVDIYRSASCVVIWLGKMNGPRNSALDFLDKLPDATNETDQQTLVKEEGTTKSRSTWSRLQESTTTFTSEVSDHWHWVNVLLILGRLWFRRAWTLQEMLLASNFRIVMGPREIAPETIIKAVVQATVFYRTDMWSIRSNMSKIMSSRNRSVQSRMELFAARDDFRKGKRYTAEEYLMVIRHREATVKKDMVVAGAALMQDNASVSLDYDSTTLEFYSAFAERLWSEAGVAGLSLVGGVVCTVEGLPSWAPDLSRSLMPLAMRYCDCPAFSAPISSWGSAFSIDGKVLRIDAAQWDVIDGVGECSWSWTRYEDPSDDDETAIMQTTPSVPAERFGLIFPLLNRIGPTYAATGERTIDAFWQTLLCGRNKKGGDEELDVWRERFFQWFAYILTSIRGTFREESNKVKSAWLPNRSTDRPWLVPLIADWPQLEQRVSDLLETHDIPITLGELSISETRASSLRQTIARVMKRILGTETIDQVDFGKSTLQEFMTLALNDGFFQPISVFGDLFETVYRGRRVVTTKKGYMGAAVESVRSGDIVCLVSGANMPYVLRPVRGKEHTFTLVGEAYIHGIMHGGPEVAQGLEFQSAYVI